MTTVLLVRHGRTASNASGTLAGRSPGVGLDEKGVDQAARAAERIAALRLDAIVSSPLERTVQTAEAILAGQRGRPGRGRSALRAKDIHLDERFIECDYGAWTGEELKRLSREPLWKVVQTHPSAAVFPEGEAMAQMQARAVAGIRAWNAQVGDRGIYAVVSHGDVIKSILADALGMHLDQFQRIQVDPGSVSVISYTDTRPFVMRSNDTGGDLSGLAPRTGRRRRSPDAPVGGGAGSP